MVKAHNLVDQREREKKTKQIFFNKIFQTRQNLIDIYARKSQKKIRPKNMQTKPKKQRCFFNKLYESVDILYSELYES